MANESQSKGSHLPPAREVTQATSKVAPTILGAGTSDGTAGLSFNFTPSLPTQDLLGDKLIQSAARANIGGRHAPTLGGIPLLAKIGQGGMGAVYYGVHPRLETEVAIKVLPFHLAEKDPDMIKRFFREAKIAAKVCSPHLINVTDVNEENGLYYLVMEFVSGESAASTLKRTLTNARSGIPEAMALDICIAATQGLAAAHTHGIVHRDIKPDNIMIPCRGEPNPNESTYDYAAAKLADLGLARGESADFTLTAKHSAMGTPGFMSPEHIEDARHCGKPSDVFSMGATLYALLAGRPPFAGDSFIKIARATIDLPHESIRTLRADVSELTSRLLDRCLSKTPSERFPDGSILLAELKLCREMIAEPDQTLIPSGEPTDLCSAQEHAKPLLGYPQDSDNKPLQGSGLRISKPQSQAMNPMLTLPVHRKPNRKQVLSALIAISLISAGSYLAWTKFREDRLQPQVLTERKNADYTNRQFGREVDPSISNVEVKAPSIELAREQYNARNYDEALASINAVLNSSTDLTGASELKQTILKDRAYSIAMNDGKVALNATTFDIAELAFQRALAEKPTDDAAIKQLAYTRNQLQEAQYIEALKEKTSDAQGQKLVELTNKRSLRAAARLVDLMEFESMAEINLDAINPWRNDLTTVGDKSAQQIFAVLQANWAYRHPESGKALTDRIVADSRELLSRTQLKSPQILNEFACILAKNDPKDVKHAEQIRADILAALDSAPPADDELLGAAFVFLSAEMTLPPENPKSGDWVRARELFERAEKMYAAAGDKLRQSDCVSSQANCIRPDVNLKGDWNKALRLFEQAENLLPVPSRKIWLSSALCGQAICLRPDLNPKGDWQKAIAIYQRVKSLWDDRKNLKHLAHTYRMIGLCWARDKNPNGDWDKALSAYEMAEKLYAEIGEKELQASMLYKQGLCCRPDLNPKGSWSKVIALFERGASLLKDSNVPRELAEGFTLLAQCWQADKNPMGDWDRALQYYNEAEKIYADADEKVSQVRLLQAQAICLRPDFNKKGDWNKAIAVYERAALLLPEGHNPKETAMTLVGLGYCWRVDKNPKGNWDKALSYYEQAEKLYSVIGDKTKQSQTVENQGTCVRPDFNQKGDWTRAIALFERAASVLDDSDPKELSIVLALKGICCQPDKNPQGNWKAALECYQFATKKAVEAGDITQEAQCLEYQGHCLKVENNPSGDWVRAASVYELAAGLREKTENKLRRALDLSQMAICLSPDHCTSGNWANCGKLFEDSAALYGELDDKKSLASCLRSAANCYRTSHSEGNYNKAAILYERAAPLFEQLKDFKSQAESLADFAYCLTPSRNLSNGNWSRAAELCNKAAAISEQIDDKKRQGIYLQQQAISLIREDAKNLTPEIRALIQKAATLRRQAGDEVGAKDAETWLR
jgi:serine/threonine protein kinase